MTSQATPRQTPPDKWRPSLGLFAACLILAVTALPLVSLVFLRLYENLLIRQTEAELIGQTAALAAVVSAAGAGLDPGPVAPPPPQLYVQDGRFSPIEPTLDLARGPVLGPRPDPKLGRMLTEAELALRDAMLPVLADTQRVTLAGFRVLAADGTVIAGGEEAGLSFGHVPEVREALAGRYAATLRDRYSDEPAPPVTSLSRGSKVRLFAAMPAVREGRVVGAVYASRSPQNVVRDLYASRGRVGLAALLTLTGAALIGVVFVRIVARPLVRLRGRAEAVARDPSAALRPLPHYGSREVASLAASLARMADALRERGEYVRTFAAHVSHELKAPLTAIAGAAEVLEDEALAPADRARFQATIAREAGRMSRLLERLRELAKAEVPQAFGACALSAVAARLDGAYPVRVEATGEARLALTERDMLAVLGHLADNAAAHGASTLTITSQAGGPLTRLTVQDDGEGVAPTAEARLFEAFYTTRRAEGGTGMGLGIARALLRAHGGDLAYDPGEAGARFVVAVPTA